MTKIVYLGYTPEVWEVTDETIDISKNKDVIGTYGQRYKSGWEGHILGRNPGLIVKHTIPPVPLNPKAD